MDSYTLPSPKLQVEMTLGYLFAENGNDYHFHTKNIVYKERFNDLPRGNTYCSLKLF